MSSVQVRPEVNALTKPQSYSLRFVPRDTLGYDELAAEVAQRNPLYNKEIGKGFLEEMAVVLSGELINGNQWTLGNLFTCHIRFTDVLMIRHGV